MTSILFNRKNGKIIRFKISGHTGKAEAGKDVLCAAISSIAQSTAVGLTEILKLDPELKFDDGFMEVILNEQDYKNEIVQVLMETCLKSLKEIVKNIDEMEECNCKNTSAGSRG